MKKFNEKIHQMVMIGLQGEELVEEEKNFLRDHPVGGFVLFSRNLKEPKQIVSLCRSLWEIRKDSPPFIAIDQEGGRVHRLPSSFIHFPPAAILGRTGNSKLAYEMGFATAHELSAVGINLNFAPVLDVNSNPDNPIIGDRALSSNPKNVTRLGWSIIRGLRARGIIPCAKHFPGHGDTSQDSHLVLPVVKKNKAFLQAVELGPFSHACRNGVDSLMTAHVLYPAIDPDFPATLSRTIITELLRKEMGYDGLVFGDDMEMKAIAQNYSVEESVTLSILAGVDTLMFCHQKEPALEAVEFLYQACEKKEEIGEKVDRSFGRIQKLKKRYLKSFTGVHEDKIHEVIGLPKHRKLIEEIQGSL